MSVTLHVHCDRCGATVTEHRTALDVRCGPLLPQVEALDLCPACASELRAWLRHREAEAVLTQTTGGA